MSKIVSMQVAIFMLLSQWGCSENSSFSELEEDRLLLSINPTPTPPAAPLESLTILYWTPQEDPVLVSGSNKTIFALTVNSGTGDVNYSYVLDEIELYSGPENYHIFDSSSFSSTHHSLTVKATNAISEATHTYTIIGNSLPVVDTKTPEATGNQILCQVDTIEFSVAASDADKHPIEFKWLLNGIVIEDIFTVTTEGNSSIALFNPLCAHAGADTVGVEISDGYDSIVATWGVDVINPTLASIISVSPNSSAIEIASNGDQQFIITATGKPPLAYEWTLNDTVITSETAATITLQGATLAPGNYTLKATVSDINSSDSAVFNVKINAPPVLSNPSPVLTTKVNYAQTQATFTIKASDLNPTDGGTLTYIWVWDNVAVSSSILSTSDTSEGSQAILQPTGSMVGGHTLKVTVSDGLETDSYDWSVYVNYFSAECNALEAGEICTLVGNPSIGHGVIPTDNPETIIMRPEQIIDDGSGNLFISDIYNDVIWFYNLSDETVNRAGSVIPAYTLKVVAGTGVQGTGSDGENAMFFELADPMGMAYNAPADVLYVAGYSNYRVFRFDGNGTGYTIFGGGTWNSAAGHVEDDVGTNHACIQPAGLVGEFDNDSDASNDILYVACSYINTDKMTSIKKISNAGNSNLALVTGNTTVGRHTAGIPEADNGEDGTTGPTGTARTNKPWAMKMHDGNLYFVENAGCRLRVWNKSASVLTYFQGSANEVNVPVGEVGSIVGVRNACASLPSAIGAEELHNAVTFDNPRGFDILTDGGSTILGFFVSSTDGHRIIFVNNSNSTSQTFGSVEINPYYGKIINYWAAYNGDGLVGISARLYYMIGLLVSDDQSTLYIADYNNERLRTYDISTPNGVVNTLLGSGNLRTGVPSEVTPQPASEIPLSNPQHVAVYDNVLYYSDRSSQRIKQVDLITGGVTTAIGNGTPANPANDQPPENTWMRYPWGIVFHDGDLLYVDNQGTSAINQTCQVRAYNRSDDTKIIFGTQIAAGLVSTIAGNTSNGCVSWYSDDEYTDYSGNQATTIPIRNPSDVASDGANLYVTVDLDNCVLKIAPDGVISQHLGKCSEGGNTDDTVVGTNTERLTRPSGIVVDPLYRSVGNLFIVDQSLSATARIKYVNNSGSAVIVAGTPVEAGRIKTIIAISGTPRIRDLAVKDNQICVAGGNGTDGTDGLHNVTCYSRSAGFVTPTLIIGAQSTELTKAGQTLGKEQEGVVANPSNVRLYLPWGITFDEDGNLYISEYYGHRIRLVKKWW